MDNVLSITVSSSTYIALSGNLALPLLNLSPLQHPTEPHSYRNRDIAVRLEFAAGLFDVEEARAGRLDLAIIDF